MSMSRDEALKLLASGMRKFTGYTAGQILESGWGGIKGLCAKDIDYFVKHKEKPAEDVARACIGRSMARINDSII